jgi:hypothetical protein
MDCSRSSVRNLWRAYVSLSQVEARNAIETVFWFRRNDIRPGTLNANFQARDQWAAMLQRRGIYSMRHRAMKRCAQCHGRLGLGVRSRNLWNGRWWVHVRFCSTHCEALYELGQYDANPPQDSTSCRAGARPGHPISRHRTGLSAYFFGPRASSNFVRTPAHAWATLLLGSVASGKVANPAFFT